MLLNSPNKDVMTEKYFIIYRSYFWYYHVNNYFKKGIDSQPTICQLGANNNIKYL